MYQDVLDFICLLYPDANSDAVDTGLNENFLVLITSNSQGIEEKFWRAGCLDLWNVVSFRGLRCEVGNGERSGQGGPNALEVRTQRLRLHRS